MRPRILDLYVSSRFAAIYLANLACFTLIFVLVDSVSQLGALSEKAEGFLGFLELWARYYAAQVPILFCRVLGGVTAAASATFAVTLLQRANELPPVLSAGISLRRLLAPVLALTLVACAASALVQEAWIPAHAAEIREAKALGRGQTTVGHAKYFDQRRRILIVFRSYRVRRLEANGVLIFPLAGHQGRRFILEAARARWVEENGRPASGRWILEDGFIQEYDGEGNVVPQDPPGGEPDSPRWLVRTFREKPLGELVDVEMIPQDLEERESQDHYLSLGTLWRRLERSPDSHRWRIRLYGRLADPLHGLILVLLGVPTILARGSRNIFLTAIATVVLCALYFMAYTFLLNLGNRGSVSPGLAVGLAPVFFGALGVTLYSRMRN